MGTSRSGAELAGKLDKAAKLLDRDMLPTAQAIGSTLTATALASAREATGGDLKFSGAQRNGRRNRPIGVTTRKESDSSVMVKATGPMHWLEAGVEPHPIIPGASKKSRGLTGALLDGAEGPALPASQVRGTARGKAKGKLMIWDGGRAAAFSVNRGGGFTERKTWSKAVEVTERAAPSIARRKLTANLFEVFG